MPTPSLDQELEKALQSAQATEAEAPASRQGDATPGDAEPVIVSSAAGRSSGGSRKGNVSLLAVLLVMAAGILLLVMSSFKNAAVYAKHVDEVVAGRSELTGKRLRVEGMLVHDTLERRDQPCEYRFQMERNGSKLAVRYPQCVVPDTFRDVAGVEVGVTVEGKLTPDGDFVATQVMAKCPSKYEQRGANADRQGVYPLTGKTE